MFRLSLVSYFQYFCSLPIEYLKVLITFLCTRKIWCEKLFTVYHIAVIVDETIEYDRYIRRKLGTILDMRDLNESVEFFVFIMPSLESLSWYDLISVLSWTSSARNSLYLWSWKHHFWGAIRNVYRGFRANNVSFKALIRLNHRSINT